MPAENEPWATELGLSADHVASLARLATLVSRSQAELIRLLADRAIRFDQQPAFWNLPLVGRGLPRRVIGFEVQWPGGFDDFVQRLRGLWEMHDGFGYLLQR
jgi:hypothetical protein